MFSSLHNANKSTSGKIIATLLSFLFAFWFVAIPVSSGFARNSHDRVKEKTIRITMKDFKFVPKKINIPTGEKVVIKFKNKGRMDHEFLAGKDVKKDGMGFKTDFFSNINVKMTVNGKQVSNDRMNKNIGTMMYLKPGQHGTMTFTVPSSKAGRYEIGCFKKMGEKTHYAIGMKGTMIVGSSGNNT